MVATLVKENTYVHAGSKIKNDCRKLILDTILRKFPTSKHKSLKTLTLGGEDLLMEKQLDKHYALKGVSYEFNPVSAIEAQINAPEGINIIQDNIFNAEVKNSKPHFVWFDFMTALRYENVSDLLVWIQNNPITNDCVFAVTYTLHSRRVKGEGYRQLFANEDEHNEFITNMANYIAMYLENDYIEVSNNFSITRYCNVDISKKSLPMVQFIFTLNKK